MRSQRELPSDHPLQEYAAPPDTDCIADVPAQILQELVEYYEDQEPRGEPIPEDEELV